MGSPITDGPRPVIHLPATQGQKLADALGIALLVVSIAIVAATLGNQPAKVPIHYGLSGAPDGYGPRYMALGLPLILSAAYALLFFLSRKPQWLNYPSKVTLQNAPRLYRLSGNLLLTIRLHLALLAIGFAIFTGYFSQGGRPLPTWLILIWLVSLIANLLASALRMSKV